MSFLGENQRASASASLSLLLPQLPHICNPSYSNYTNSQNIAFDPIWCDLKSSGVTYLWFCLAGVHATSLSTLGIRYLQPKFHLGTWANSRHWVENFPLSWSDSWSPETLSKHFLPLLIVRIIGWCLYFKWKYPEFVMDFNFNVAIYVHLFTLLWPDCLQHKISRAF